MTLIVAHRGAPDLAHENTIDSFLAAINAGADMVELDIRKCGDGTAVIHHDPWFSRAARRGQLSEMTYEQLNVRAAKQGFRVPIMKEAFAALSGKTTLDIEIKEPGYEKEVLDCAHAYFDTTGFVCTSFDPRVIRNIKAIDPAVETGFILNSAAMFDHCINLPVEVIAPDKRLFTAHRAFWSDLKNNAGKKIAVWTVDGAPLISRLLADPLVDAIITNRPDRALALRKKRGKQ